MDLSHRARLLSILAILILGSQSLILTVPAQGRTDDRAGASRPSWEIDDAWSYRTDDQHLDAYGIVIVTIPDPDTGIPVDTVLCNFPTSRVIEQEYRVYDKGSVDMNITSWENVTEPGNWMMRKLVGGVARCDAGDVVAKGTYNKTENNTGSEIILLASLNPNGDFLSAVSVTEYDGDYYFIITIRSRYSTTVDKACQEWKPDWDLSPMNVDDKWRMDCTQTQTYVEDWNAMGNLNGSFTNRGTYHFKYDINWTVMQMAAQMVLENTYPESYELRGVGTMVWDWQDDEGNSDSGKGNIQSSKWYADQGQYWDAGWGIIYEGQKLLEWSTYGPPIDWNSPPQVTEAPPQQVDIYEDDEWTFSDYAVKDTDPGACGSAGFKYSVSALFDTEAALAGLSIDQSGTLTFKPVQKDVADDYQITISVSDSCPGSAQTTSIPFVLNIKNVNDAPTANTSVMMDSWIYEGNGTTSYWSLFDVFHDIDMDKSPLTGEPYDPLEGLSYTVSNNGTLWVDTDKTKGNVSFWAPDKQFPGDQNFSLTFTATDHYGAKASDGMTVHVMHKNHNPTTLAGKDTITIDEDDTKTLSFRDYFSDFDVQNPGYLTNDRLYYYAWARGNVTVEPKDEQFKMSPWTNWNGEETIYLRASDMWGGRADTRIKLVVRPVNDPPKVYFQTPEAPEVLEMDEPQDPWSGGGNDLPRTLILSVTAQDLDDNDIFYNWTVEDLETGDLLDWAIKGNESMMTFRTSYTGEFLDGNFTGGRDFKEYKVVVKVTDGKVTIDGGSWTIRVYNVNRVPRIVSMSVFKIKNGLRLPVLEDDFRNYTFEYGKTYEVSLAGYLIDGDTPLKDLDCKWTIDQSVAIITGKCDERSAINITTGKRLGLAQAKLKPGTHLVQFTVTDDLGAKDELQMWITVKKPPPTVWDNFMANGMFLAFSIGLIVSMFFVGFLIAVLRTRQMAQRRAPPPGKVAVKKGAAPRLPPRAPFIPPGKVPKKVVRRKVAAPVSQAPAEPVRPSGLKFKKKPAKSSEEDLPDDWK